MSPSPNGLISLLQRLLFFIFPPTFYLISLIVYIHQEATMTHTTTLKESRQHEYLIVFMSYPFIRQCTKWFGSKYIWSVFCLNKYCTPFKGSYSGCHKTQPQSVIVHFGTKFIHTGTRKYDRPPLHVPAVFLCSIYLCRLIMTLIVYTAH